VHIKAEIGEDLKRSIVWTHHSSEGFERLTGLIDELVAILSTPVTKNTKLKSDLCAPAPLRGNTFEWVIHPAGFICSMFSGVNALRCGTRVVRFVTGLSRYNRELQWIEIDRHLLEKSKLSYKGQLCPIRPKGAKGDSPG